jgi:hypothetical protein
LKLIKTTVLTVYAFSSSSSMPFWKIFMPLSTFFGEV